jgi:hypothetical protein
MDAAVLHHSVGGEAHGNIARCASRILSRPEALWNELATNVSAVLLPGSRVHSPAALRRLPVPAWTEKLAALAHQHAGRVTYFFDSGGFVGSQLLQTPGAPSQPPAAAERIGVMLFVVFCRFGTR